MNIDIPKPDEFINFSSEIVNNSANEFVNCLTEEIKQSDNNNRWEFDY